MPQERLTAKFFTQNGASQVISKGSDLAQLLKLWIDNPTEFKVLKENFFNLRYEEDPVLVIKDLVELARQAADGEQLEMPLAVV
jgi:processive 1,2-diacylglycerol beta-glucosyltransferase